MVRPKFVKFLMSILKWQFNSSLNFVSTLRLMKGNYTLHFISDNICFYQKEIIKVKIFETFECSGQDLSNSLRQFWNEKSIPLQILYPPSVSWRKTSLYFFSSNNIYFSQNELMKMNIFDTFKCFGQNLSNSSRQLWNDKSIPLQILRHSSL